jgi:hypothetical protein
MKTWSWLSRVREWSVHSTYQVERQTSSNPRRSHRAFHENDLKNAYSSLEAFLKRVRSSPRTMTRSGHSLFASVISWSLWSPCDAQVGRLSRAIVTRALALVVDHGTGTYSFASHVVASHDDLLLLHSQGQGFEMRRFIFKDAGVEAVLCGDAQPGELCRTKKDMDWLT